MRRQTWLLGGAALALAVLVLVALLPRSRREVAEPAPSEAPPAGVAELPLAPRELAPVPERTPIAQEAPVGTEELTVVALDARSERPLAGAIVTAVDVEQLMQALESAGLVYDTPRARLVRRSLETRAVTDAEGRALLAVPPARWMVEARAGDLWAFAMLNTLPPDRTVAMRLGPDRELRVLVTAPDGVPREDVPVALRQRRRSVVDPSPKVTTTDGGGLASFLHFQRRLQQGEGWEVGFAFPVRGEPAEAVGDATPHDPPISLVLSGAGGLRVRVRDPQGATPDRAGCELRVRAFDPAAGGEPLWFDGPWSRRTLDGKGEASFPWIGLGLDLAVELRREAAASALGRTTIAGPRSEGEIVACELVLEGLPRIAGRFVRNDGSPWPACTVHAQAMPMPAPADYPQGQDLQVDAEGRFSFEPAYLASDGGMCPYRLQAPHPDGLGHAKALVAIPGRVAPSGVDLGDVLLDHGPMLGSGHVLDESGTPIAGVRLRLEAESVVQRQEIWHWIHTSGKETTGADGAFAIFLPPGEMDPGEALRLAIVRCEGYVRGEPQPIRRGDSRIVVALERAGSLAGSVELDGGLAPGDVMLSLVGATRHAFQLSPDALFAVDGLAPGEYALEARLRGANGRAEEEPAAVVAGLWISPGETNRDARLQPLRLESELETLRITAVDARGLPIPGATAAVVGLRSARPAIAGQDGICRVRASELPIDVEVSAFGYRRHRLERVSADTAVVLDEGLAVRLVAGAAGSGRAPAYRLFALVFESDERGIPRGLVYPDSFPVDRRWFDPRGQLALRLPGPGAYECSLSVSVIKDHVGCGAPVATPAPLRFTVLESDVEQVFELGVPQSAVDAAVARALE